MSPNFFENGYYIPFIFLFIYIYSNDLFLSTMITLKLFPFNYYLHFYDKYSFLSGKFNMIKQFVRFTDSGHIVSLLYYIYPQYAGLAFNVHFVITFAYWIGIFLFSLKDEDDIIIQNFDHNFCNFWTLLIHSVPIILITYNIKNSEFKDELFGINDLYLSFLWGYCWLFFIYLPWRYFTGDCVYSIFSNRTPILSIVKFLFMTKIILLISNSIGHYYLNN